MGVQTSAVLRRAGLPQGLLEQTRALLSTEELFAFWRAVEDCSSDPLIGLSLGSETRIEQFHPISLAALATENFGAAVNQLARYKQLTCPEKIVSSIRKDEWSIEFRWFLIADATPLTLLDYCFAWLLTIVRHGTGVNLSPVRLEFVQPRQQQRQIERHFGCPVVCEASRNAVIFRANDAQRPFLTRNADLLSMLAPQFEAELKRRNSEESFSDQVRAAILERLTGAKPTMPDVSRSLHMSPRTLQRRLQDEGLNFQGMLEEARHQMASHYLSNSELELNEIAYLLGYEDPNSFVRAFRIRVGIPPGHWRESRAAKSI